MNATTLIIVLKFTILFIGYWTTLAHAIDLPIPSTPDQSAILLDLGNKVVTDSKKYRQLKIYKGELVKHDGDTTVEIDDTEIRSLHPGFGHWSINFRFNRAVAQPTQSYVFWARWRQGGDPAVCIQTYEIWAGPDQSQLALRGSVTMQPKGWDYAWLSSKTAINLQSQDKVIEIRNNGAGHDAKVFDAFLLTSPLATLPISSEPGQPMLLLELGKESLLTTQTKNPDLILSTGTAIKGPDAESILTEKDEVQVFHKGFGNWSAVFNFALPPNIKPGLYQFYARYKSGGEVNQVTQQFNVKVGDNVDNLTSRAEFLLTNDKPWEYQWLQAENFITLLPGDHWLEITNIGKADGAKVFDAFLLKPIGSLTSPINAKQAILRKQFLAMASIKTSAERQIYVLDSMDKSNDLLFNGLLSERAKSSLKSMSISYVAGNKAENWAKELNISALPAAVITDDHYSLLGVLSHPKHEDDVADFLLDPLSVGYLPTPLSVKPEKPKALLSGIPEAWLVGGLHDCLAGMSLFGLDTEAILRPNPQQNYPSLQMMGGEMKTWQIAKTQADGTADIETNTQHDYSWSKGSGYAHLYLYVEKTTSTLLHLKHSGIKSALWLDGVSVPVSDDPFFAFGYSSKLAQFQTLLKGMTTEDQTVTVLIEKPQFATLTLRPGWHNLLLKVVMQHTKNQRFYFTGLFSDPKGLPLNTIQTQLSDPIANRDLNKIAAQLRPVLHINAPANLAHPNELLSIHADIRWHSILEESKLPLPLPRFNAKLKLTIVDYEGQKREEREITGMFPDSVNVKFSKSLESGFYAIYPSLYTREGQLIMHFPADGFSVINNYKQQKQRLSSKKIWNNDYYAFADGDKSFLEKNSYFTWLKRMGIFRSYGGYPGFEQTFEDKWQKAKTEGIQMFADSSGDSNWLNDNPEASKKFIESAAKFTNFFKSTNEIDIRTEAQWQQLREPKHWVKRAQSEYDHIHKTRSDGFYVGGSLVRPGDNGEAGHWFQSVVQLGLDQFQDAWDIHAYPQLPPRFNNPLGNSESEDERGILLTYKRLGKTNLLPFWLGETGAKAMHGFTGRRWQAEQVAKMVAWVNSRPDYLGIAFCIGHEYDLAYGRLWDYSLGHKPGEAALYTASALIDGLPYRAIDSKDPAIQAAYFGTTLMLWRTDESTSNWQIALSKDKPWVVVNVVGSSHPLNTDTSGRANIPITSSPVYVLSKADYDQLLR